MSKVDELIVKYQNYRNKNNKFISGEWATTTEIVEQLKAVNHEYERFLEDLKVIKAEQEIDNWEKMMDKRFLKVCGKNTEEAFQYVATHGLVEEQQKPVIQVPAEVKEYLDHMRQCKDINILTVAWYQNVRSFFSQAEKDKAKNVSEWAIKNHEQFAEAYRTGNYEVEQEQLYYMPVPYLDETYYFRDGDGNLDSEYRHKEKFTKYEIETYFSAISHLAVPVKEEAE